MESQTTPSETAFSITIDVDLAVANDRDLIERIASFCINEKHKYLLGEKLFRVLWKYQDDYEKTDSLQNIYLDTMLPKAMVSFLLTDDMRTFEEEAEACQENNE